MKYTYRAAVHWKENPQILDQEIDQLQKWLHNSNIDPDFDPSNHVYHHIDNGDVWLMLPELTQRQEMAATLILSSSELFKDDNPVKFDLPPNAKVEDYDDL